MHFGVSKPMVRGVVSFRDGQHTCDTNCTYRQYC